METVDDKIGSAQLVWSLLDLHKKEGGVILKLVVSYHDCREKKIIAHKDHF